MGYDTLVLFSMYSPILPLIILLKNIRRVTVIYAVTLLLLTIIPFFSDWFCYYSSYLFHSHNCNPIFHVYTLSIGLVIAFLFHKELRKKNLSLILLFLTTIFIFLSFFEFFYLDGYLKNDTLSNTYLTILVFSFSLVYFYHLLIEMKIANILTHSFFWICSAFIVYFGATFSISIFEEIVRSDNMELFLAVWPIQLVTTIIYNLLLTIAFWNLKKT